MSQRNSWPTTGSPVRYTRSSSSTKPLLTHRRYGLLDSGTFDTSTAHDEVTEVGVGVVDDVMGATQDRDQRLDLVEYLPHAVQGFKIPCHVRIEDGDVHR